MLFDVLVIEIRDGCVARSQELYLVQGVRCCGRRQRPGLCIGHAVSGKFELRVMKHKTCRPNDMRIAIVDG